MILGDIFDIIKGGPSGGSGGSATGGAGGSASIGDVLTDFLKDGIEVLEGGVKTAAQNQTNLYFDKQFGDLLGNSAESQGRDAAKRYKAFHDLAHPDSSQWERMGSTATPDAHLGAQTKRSVADRQARAQELAARSSAAAQIYNTWVNNNGDLGEGIEIVSKLMEHKTPTDRKGELPGHGVLTRAQIESGKFGAETHLADARTDHEKVKMSLTEAETALTLARRDWQQFELKYPTLAQKFAATGSVPEVLDALFPGEDRAAVDKLIEENIDGVLKPYIGEGGVAILKGTGAVAFVAAVLKLWRGFRGRGR